jgi:hypothetical protein
MLIPCFFFYKADIISNQCSFPTEIELSWVLIYFKIQFILFRTLFPFLIMILSTSIITLNIYKRRLIFVENEENKRIIQLIITLITMDVIFLLLKLPTLLYIIITNNGTDKIIYSFTYSLCISIGAMYSSFYFVIFLVLNKSYRSFFFVYLNICCRALSSRIIPVNS